MSCDKNRVEGNSDKEHKQPLLEIIATCEQQMKMILSTLIILGLASSSLAHPECKILNVRPKQTLSTEVTLIWDVNNDCDQMTEFFVEAVHLKFLACHGHLPTGEDDLPSNPQARGI